LRALIGAEVCASKLEVRAGLAKSITVPKRYAFKTALSAIFAPQHAEL
jgi:hypothetical protein